MLPMVANHGIESGCHWQESCNLSKVLTHSLVQHGNAFVQHKVAETEPEPELDIIESPEGTTTPTIDHRFKLLAMTRYKRENPAQSK